MAVNSNAQAIKVCNEQVRVMADLLAQLYNAGKLVGQIAVAQNWNGTLFVTDADTIGDGSGPTGDGRPTITNGQVKIVLANLATFVADMEASSSLKLNQTLVASVNPKK